MGFDQQVFAVIDTETTGLDPEKDELVEIACVMTSLARRNLGMFATLVKPGIPIPPEVSAVHGITDADVAGAPTPQEGLHALGAFLGRYWGHNGDFYVPVAHHADFDVAFLPGMESREKWLCTKRLAMHLWPKAPNHRNQTLRYWRGLNPETFGIAAHRALGDALVTAASLRDQLTCAEFDAVGVDGAEALIAYAESPILFKNWPPFGKHSGAPMDSIPRDYFDWALGPRGITDMSRDLRYSIETELNRRRAAA